MKRSERERERGEGMAVDCLVIVHSDMHPPCCYLWYFSGFSFSSPLIYSFISFFYRLLPLSSHNLCVFIGNQAPAAAFAGKGDSSGPTIRGGPKDCQ